MRQRKKQQQKKSRRNIKTKTKTNKTKQKPVASGKLTISLTIFDTQLKVTFVINEINLNSRMQYGFF